jgi:hypothetical protein
MTPSDPFFKNSSPSSATSSSSLDNSGDASKIDLNSPTPLSGENVTVNVNVSLAPIIYSLGLISNAESRLY